MESKISKCEKIDVNHDIHHEDEETVAGNTSTGTAAQNNSVEVITPDKMLHIKQEPEYNPDCSYTQPMEDTDNEEEQQFYSMYEVYEMVEEDEVDEEQDDFSDDDFTDASEEEEEVITSEEEDAVDSDDDDYNAPAAKRRKKSSNKKEPRLKRGEASLIRKKEIEQIAERFKKPPKLEYEPPPPQVEPSPTEESNAKPSYTNKFLQDKYMLWICPICGLETQNKFTWRKHLGEAHDMLKRESLHMDYVSQRKARCQQCKQEMPSVFFRILLHEVSHMQNNNFMKCKLCEELYGNILSLAFHLREVHAAEIAEDLQSPSEAVKSLKEVVFTVCPFCRVPFSDGQNVYLHINRAHRRENTFKCLHICPECGVEYKNRSDFHKHLVERHDYDEQVKSQFVETDVVKEFGVSKAFKCLQCSWLDKQRISLKAREHALIHTGKKCLKCMHCQTHFDTYIEMRVHFCKQLLEYLASIVDQRKQRIKLPRIIVYACPMCGESFTTKDKRQHHERSVHDMGTPKGLNFMLEENPHSSSKRFYTCTECDKRLKLDISAMRQHAVNHMPHGCFKCSKCGEYFSKIYQTHTHSCVNSFKQSNKVYFSVRECQEMVWLFCPACNTPLDSVQDFWAHIKSAHELESLVDLHMKIVDEKFLRCLDCSALIHSDSDSAKVEHRFVHLPFKAYKCKQCAQEFATLFHVSKHAKSCTPHMEHKSKTKVVNVSKKQSRVIGKNGRLVLPPNVAREFIQITCHYCGEQDFADKSALNRHLWSKHNSLKEYYIVNPDGSMNCNECSRFFNDSTKSSMVKHQYTHFKNSFSCRQCGFSAQYQKTLSEHLKEFHIRDMEYYMERLGGASTTTDPLSTRTEAIARTSKVRIATQKSRALVFNQYDEHITYACPECNQPLPNQNDWHAHINTQHTFFHEDEMNFELTSDGNQRCKDCGVKMETGVSPAQRHKLTHMPFKSYICTLCLHRSNTAGPLIQHLRRRHFLPGKYECEVCKEVFNTQFDRYQHIKAHNVDDWPEFMCRVCYQVYSSKSSLINHMSTHDPNRKMVQCEYCKRNYTTTTEMMAHMRKIHYEQLDDSLKEGFVRCKHECHICKIDFNTMEAVRTHMRGHSAAEIPKTICEICGRLFKSAKSCVQHKKRHITYNKTTVEVVEGSDGNGEVEENYKERAQKRKADQEEKEGKHNSDEVELKQIKLEIEIDDERIIPDD